VRDRAASGHGGSSSGTATGWLRRLLPQRVPQRQAFDNDLTLPFVALLVAMGLVVVWWYGRESAPRGMSKGAASGLLIMVSFGSAVVGGLVGFLFGIPRARQVDQVAGRVTGRYVPNTNLERISDWLTTILVGLGLTQLGTIPGRLQGLAAYLARGLGNDDRSEVSILIIVLYFLGCGFLYGYHWSRTTLERLLNREEDDGTTSAGFALAVAVPSQTVAAGATAVVSYTVTLNTSGGYVAPVQLSVIDGLPQGATATFNPSIIAPPAGTATLTIATSPTTPRGTYLLTVTGVGGDTGRATCQTSVTLVVA
jgi:hypothetical protein